jgi:hypothetical protein
MAESMKRTGDLGTALDVELEEWGRLWWARRMDAAGPYGQVEFLFILGIKRSLYNGCI